MSNIIELFNITSQTAGQITNLGQVTNIIDFQNVLAQNGYTAIGGGVGKAVSGLSQAELESAIAGTATSPTTFQVIEGGAGVTSVTATAGTVTTAAGGTSTATVAMSPKVGIIMAVAAVMGYGIGWDIAQQIDEWLTGREFDWGRDSIGGKIVTYVTQGVEGESFYTYVCKDLVDRLIMALEDWGILHHPTTIPPELMPDFEHATTYDFNGRFPNLPDGLAKNVQKLINRYNIDVYGKYVSVGLSAEDMNMILTVFNTPTFNLLTRNALTNSGQIIPSGTTRLSVRAGSWDFKYAQWEIWSDGTMRVVTPWTSITTSINFVNSVRGYAWDNFGEYFRQVDSNNQVGSKINQVVDIKQDPNGVTVDHNTNIESDWPNWWAKRIYAQWVDFSTLLKGNTFDRSRIEEIPYLPVRLPSYTPLPAEYPTEGQPVPEQYTPPQHEIIEDPEPTPVPTIEPWPEEWPEPGKNPEDDPQQDPHEDPHDDPEWHPEPDPQWPDPNPYSPDDPDPTPDAPEYPDPVPDPTPTPTPTPPDPSSDTPIIPTLPTTEGYNNGMVSLYGPSYSQLREFSGWLWSLTEDLIAKLFQNPMQAVIGLHKIYASPTIVTSGHIVVGNIVTDASSNIISQYTTINCGSVKINKYFKNVHDYIGTSIQIYLPYIGIVNLNTADVMDKTVQVIYKIDWMSGACLAFINLKKGSGNFYTAYTFSGNCAVEYPITGSNYSGVVGAGIMATGSIAAALITKNPATAISGVTGAVAGSNVDICRSGNISGNAGAMGIKKPYILINRNYPIEASNRGHFEGLPQRKTVKLSTQSGYTRVNQINLNNLPATETEKEQIRAKLMEGIIL